MFNFNFSKLALGNALSFSPYVISKAIIGTIGKELITASCTYKVRAKTDKLLRTKLLRIVPIVIRRATTKVNKVERN